MVINALTEDIKPQPLAVTLSSQINNKIAEIGEYNRDNVEAREKWHDYLDGIKNYLSNPSIAFDYANRNIRFPNGAYFIRDFDYDVGYAIKYFNSKAYVYIFKMNLKPAEFGLRVPPTVESANKDHHQLNCNSETIFSPVNEWMVKLGCIPREFLCLCENRQAQLLNESQESKSIDAAKKLVMQRFGWDNARADHFVRI